MNVRTFIPSLAILVITQCALADNGHLISTSVHQEYRIAVFAEPWPPRVGELQLQFIITDPEGNLVIDESLVPLQQMGRIVLEEPGPFTFSFALGGELQPAISFEVLPKASIFTTYWQLWSFLIFGLIIIILRENLARMQARRYPSL